MYINAIGLNMDKTNKNHYTKNTKTNFNGIFAYSKKYHEYYYYPFIHEDEEEISANIKKFKENYQGDAVDIVRIAHPLMVTEMTCDKKTVDRIAKEYTIISNSAK